MTTKLSAEEQKSVDNFRREVEDKIGVVFNGCHSTPLERSIHRKQCEDFLVELYAAALTAAAEREQGLREENERLKAGRVWDVLERARRAEAEVARLTGELAHAETERDDEFERARNLEVRADKAEAALAAEVDRTNWLNCDRDGLEAQLRAERQKVTALVEKLVEMRKHTAKAIEHRHGYPKGDAFGDGLVHGHMNHLSALDSLGLPSPDAPQPPQENRSE